MSKGVQIAGGATLIALILGWYAVTNRDIGAAFTYYESLSAFRHSPEALEGKDSRVRGFVALDSIQRDVAAKQVRFAIVNDPPHRGNAGAPLEVVFSGLETPDLFKGGAEIVVEGRLVNGGSQAVFHADKLFAKCPSKFKAQEAQTASS